MSVYVRAQYNPRDKVFWVYQIHNVMPHIEDEVGKVRYAGSVFQLVSEGPTWLDAKALAKATLITYFAKRADEHAKTAQSFASYCESMV